MRPALFRTRITELLGIRHPILCGGMGPGVNGAVAAGGAAVMAVGGGLVLLARWRRRRSPRGV